VFPQFFPYNAALPGVACSPSLRGTFPVFFLANCGVVLFSLQVAPPPFGFPSPLTESRGFLSPQPFHLPGLFFPFPFGLPRSVAPCLFFKCLPFAGRPSPPFDFLPPPLFRFSSLLFFSRYFLYSDRRPRRPFPPLFPSQFFFFRAQVPQVLGCEGLGPFLKGRVGHGLNFFFSSGSPRPLWGLYPPVLHSPLSCSPTPPGMNPPLPPPFPD